MKSGLPIAQNLRRFVRLIDDNYTDIAAKKGILTLPQLLVLSTVGRDGPQITPDLIAKTGIDRSTMSAMLNRLYAQGLLQREKALLGNKGPAPFRVSLTAAGSRALKASDTAMRLAEITTMRKAPAADRERFASVLSQILAP